MYYNITLTQLGEENKRTNKGFILSKVSIFIHITSQLFPVETSKIFKIVFIKTGKDSYIIKRFSVIFTLKSEFSFINYEKTVSYIKYY